MAGGLSAGSVRDTRRPRRVLPGGVTSLGGAALLPGAGAPEKVGSGGPRRGFAPEKPSSEQPGPDLTGRQSEARRATSQKHLWGQNGACPATLKETRRAGAVTLPSANQKVRCQCDVMAASGKEPAGRMAWEREVRLCLNADREPDLDVCLQWG